MKYLIHMHQSLPFAQNPVSCELEGEKIICNDVQLPHHIDASNGYNPHNVRMWVIGHEFGAICAVSASHEGDVLDAAVDSNMLDCLLDEEQDYENEELTPLGNASELFDLSMAWLAPVEFDAARDIHLIVALAKAAGAGDNNLS